MSTQFKLLSYFSILFSLWTCQNVFAARSLARAKIENQLGNYSSAAVTIDGKPCAQIGL